MECKIYFAQQRMKTIMFLLCVALFLSFSVHGDEASENFQDVTVSIRAAYFQLTSAAQGAERLQQLHQHGFNTILVADKQYPLAEELWQAWATLAEQSGIQLIPVLNFAVPKEFRPLSQYFRPYVDRYGATYQNTPCPLDAEYWQTVIGARFQRLAEIIPPIAGIVFDSEMYGSDISLYTSPCLCDSCWQTFLRNEKLDARTIAPEQRFNYLLRNGLLLKYVTVQTHEVEVILRQIEQHVHAAAPQLRLGFLMYTADNWFYTGLIRGFGAANTPVLVFSESTYVQGYIPAIVQEIRGVEKAGEDNGLKTASGMPLARYIPGLWLARFFPDDLPSQLYQLATHTDGYWIYTADSLWQSTDEQSQSGDLHGNPDDYWKSLKAANDELIRFSESPAPDHSALPSIFPSSFYDPEKQRLLTPPSVQTILSIVAQDVSENLSGLNPVETSHAPQASIIYREHTLFHCLNPNGGTIAITHVPIGKDPDPDFYQSFGKTIDPTAFILFDDAGHILKKGSIDHRAGAASFFVTPDESGMISLLTHSTINGTRVMFSGLACVVEASSTFPLSTWNSSYGYRIHLSQEQSQIKIRGYSPSQEAAILTIRSSDFSVNQTIEINGFTEMRVVIDRNGITPFYQVLISPVPTKPFADVRIALYDEEFPYLKLD